MKKNLKNNLEILFDPYITEFKNSFGLELPRNWSWEKINFSFTNWIPEILNFTKNHKIKSCYLSIDLMTEEDIDNLIIFLEELKQSKKKYNLLKKDDLEKEIIDLTPEEWYQYTKQ